MSRVLTVSHRLPLTARDVRGSLRLVPSPGGLATALREPHERSEGLWFGWPGDLSGSSSGERREVEAQLREQRAIPVGITPREMAHYHDGFSNGVLWPLLHYQIDKVHLDAERDWHVYQQVNQRFASAVAAEYRPGDVIWVHDYQLALVPEYLRRKLPHARIGFFLHVPFPAAEVFRVLPWRSELLRGLLAADVVGFHTAGYRHNFAHAAALVLGLDLGLDTIQAFGRDVRIGVYPISVDAAVFERESQKPAVAAEVERLRMETGGKRIVLGIDRLDYTKGIPRRLLAIDRFLSREPAARNKVHFIQVAVPTREKVDAYSELRRSVNELVGRLNSHHGTPSAAPIQLLYRSIPFSQMVALYRAADVMLVTPLRDGMNLVAKEYVASRTDDRGALVLSELAGAADELSGALTVNPYDLSQVSRALVEALDMSEAEQRSRMSAMRNHLRQADVHAWCAAFLRDLQGREPPSLPPAPVVAARRSLTERLRDARTSPARLVLLDYDGTLVPLAAAPELAVPSREVLRTLRALASLPHTEVHIMTGRARESIEGWLGDLPITLHAEHGFWSRWGRDWVANASVRLGWEAPILALLGEAAAQVPGAFVEAKTASVALHYRATDPRNASELLRGLLPRLQEVARQSGVEILHGAKVLEVRVSGANKGAVTTRLIADLHPEATVIAAGDDRTDEDMFRALPPSAVSVRVGAGAGPSSAVYSVEHPSELLSLLGMMLPERPAELLAGTPAS